MAEPFIGQIEIFGGNFPPRGWAFCNGDLLSIAQNTALFSILGTTYGGDGRTTFGLPDLRGRVPINSGGNSTGPGVPRVNLGEKAGSPTVTLTSNNLPSHTHALDNASDDIGASRLPTDNYLADTSEPAYAQASLADTRIGPAATQSSGNNQSFENRKPFLGVNFIIATQGLYPSRS